MMENTFLVYMICFFLLSVETFVISSIQKLTGVRVNIG